MDDFGDYHKASTNESGILILGNFDVNYFRMDDRRRDEPGNANEMMVTKDFWIAYRRNMNAPMAAYFDSGQTSDLESNCN